MESALIRPHCAGRSAWIARAQLLSSVCIAVVGTRHPTPYGIAASERLSGDLARVGVTITSGMARGIDSAAHKAALAAEGTEPGEDIHADGEYRQHLARVLTQRALEHQTG